MSAIISRQLLNKMVQLRQSQINEIEQWVDMWLKQNDVEYKLVARENTLPDFMKTKEEYDL